MSLYGNDIPAPDANQSHLDVSGTSSAAVAHGRSGKVYFAATGATVHLVFGESGVRAATTDDVPIPAGQAIALVVNTTTRSHFRAVGSGAGILQRRILDLAHHSG